MDLVIAFFIHYYGPYYTAYQGSPYLDWLNLIWHVI